VIKIENPQKEFIYFLEKNEKGELISIKTTGDVTVENDYYFKGKFKFEADSENINLILLSPFGANKFEGELRERIFLLTKILFSPLKYIGSTKVSKAFKRKNESVFKLEGGIEVVFDENKRFKRINLPEAKIFIVWNKDMPYNIKMKTKEGNITIEIKNIKTQFKNGKN